MNWDRLRRIIARSPAELIDTREEDIIDNNPFRERAIRREEVDYARMDPIRRERQRERDRIERQEYHDHLDRLSYEMYMDDNPNNYATYQRMREAYEQYLHDRRSQMFRINDDEQIPAKTIMKVTVKVVDGKKVTE